MENRSFRIVRATTDHAAGVRAVFQAVQFHADSAQGTEGYLVLEFSEDQYARHFSAPNAVAYVAVDDAGTVVGFLWAVLQSREVDCYIEQIGILPAWKGAGVAAALYDELMRNDDPLTLGCTIMHGPVANLRSQSFFKKRHFQLVSETEEPPFVWGHYERRSGATV